MRSVEGQPDRVAERSGCVRAQSASRAVLRFYNKRGTAEQWIKEGKQAVKMTRLSCHRFRSNEVRLWLSVIAYMVERLVMAVQFMESGSQNRNSGQNVRKKKLPSSSSINLGYP
jgi:hypothetical protein